MSNASEPVHLLTCDEMQTLDMPVGDFLCDLEDELGPDAVWELTGAYGGRSIYLPTREMIHRSVLIEQISRQTVQWLYDRFGSGRLMIPMGPHARTARIIATYRNLLRANLTHSQIAKHMACHVRTVERNATRLRDAGFI